MTDQEFYKEIIHRKDTRFRNPAHIDTVLKKYKIDGFYHWLQRSLYKFSDKEKWYNLTLECIRRAFNFTCAQIYDLIEEEKQFWTMIDRQNPAFETVYCFENQSLPTNAEGLRDYDYNATILAYNPTKQMNANPLPHLKPTRSTALNTLFDLAVEHGMTNSVDPYLYDHIMSFAEPDPVMCSCCRRLVTINQFPEQVIFRPYKDKDGHHLIKACKECHKKLSQIVHQRFKHHDGRWLTLPALISYHPDDHTYYAKAAIIQH